MTITQTTITRIGPLTIHRIESSQNSLAEGGNGDDQPICDDGSILLSACQSFFGQEEDQQDDGDNDNNNKIVGSSSHDDFAGSKKQQQQQHYRQQSSSTAVPSITLPSNNNSLFQHNNNSRRRARSMSPSTTTTTNTNEDQLLFYNCSPKYYGASEESDYQTNNSTMSMKSNSWSRQDWSTSYFETSDFHAQTWLTVLQETETMTYCGAGAAILTAVIIIHPLALIGAAATAAVGASAAWAVGRFHDLDTGYQIWNHDDFGMLFWEEPAMAVVTNGGGGGRDEEEDVAAIATVGSRQIIQRNEEGLRRAFLLEQEQVKLRQVRAALLKEETNEGENNDVQQTNDNGDGVSLPRHHYNQQQSQQAHVEKKLQSISLQETNRFIRVNSAPVKELSPRVKSSRSSSKQQQQQQHLLPPRQPNKATQHPNTLPPSTVVTTQQSLDRHYPPLEIRVVNQIQFHGLNTSEFFQVFFSDSAPYSMKDFQQKRGDVDIHYGPWHDTCNNTLHSFQKSGGEGGALFVLLPLPPNSTRERTLTFNTLTKSYFGPAYAKATKVQRATRLSKHLLVIENETQLSEVPFSDRFKVLERWVVEAVKSIGGGGGKNNDGGQGGGGGGLYTCKLTVHAEVIMISPCKFEAQIRKKAAETFTDLTKGWCKLATKALEATKEQKRKRMRNEQQQQQQQQQFFNDDDDKDDAVVDDASARKRRIKSMKSQGATESELFAKHQKKFQELDNLISHGDGGIEVMHSIQAGAHSAFAEVLESSSESESSRLLKLRDGTVVEVARRRRRGSSPFSRIPKKMNKTLLRKISRVSFAKQAR